MSARGPETPATSHAVARAWRIRAVHVRDATRHVCGLCLHQWPCAERAWADRILLSRHASPPADGR